jgi:aminoglycoside phosphotransferase family enzyme
MTADQVNQLIAHGKFPEFANRRELIETHISWVIIGTAFVFKIKKPMYYSFLDFSTLEKRKYFCEREIELNKRLAPDWYLDVLPVKENNGSFSIGGEKGSVIDYAVRMKKLDQAKQMDVLLRKNKVTASDIRALAKIIADFHRQAVIISEKDYLDVQKKFNALLEEADFLRERSGTLADDLIRRSVEQSDIFINAHRGLLIARLNSGLFRDCHGDLHARNIFLLPDPVIFDCIEFSDEYRQIDVLNEVAFLCMDLDAFGRPDLSDQFISYYNGLFPTMKTAEERQLFIYYKSYRANVRAKVNSLRARGAASDSQKTLALAETDKYLRLMMGYLSKLVTSG